ncbi:hypothetical protein [Spirosoma validum]|uniref:Uncharacterized protein n=1 Tax=Spirosoma validum TaxID=2771355 RepID=A0A927B2Q7_9BACT|nr:hypothetical protein [Spirosoma validum]MBD2754320.1 hypothetical protein [Spirosoma validum]
MKPTVKNIINLWFGADTPIRQFKLRLNPAIGIACQKVKHSFEPPSGAIQVGQYRKSDKLAFAVIAIRELNQAILAPESSD